MLLPKVRFLYVYKIAKCDDTLHFVSILLVSNSPITLFDKKASQRTHFSMLELNIFTEFVVSEISMKITYFAL